MADFFSIYDPPPTPAEIKSGLKCIVSFSQAPPEIIEKLPAFAAIIAKNIGDKVTPTQLRRFFTYVKSIEIVNRDSPLEIFKEKYKLNFILPKIAGSSERTKLDGLYEILSVCLPKIKTVSDLRIFVEFFEAILDYHASIKRNNS